AVTFNPNGPWYVASARCSSTDLLHDPLVIASGNPPNGIEIQLSDDGATLSGTVTSGGAPVPASVLLIPDQAPARTRNIATDGFGRFELQMLPPGSYNVIAFDRTNDLEYANPIAMQPYTAAETRIALTANGKSMVQLHLTRRGD